MQDLFADFEEQGETTEPIVEGAVLFRRRACSIELDLLKAITQILQQAPLRHLETPGGRKMSVAMSNCGALGWVSDRKGYRYAPIDPLSGEAWPTMPGFMQEFARDVAASAGYPAFAPDACLINEYLPGARMGLHQDRDENDFSQPIVSVSLGLPATFLFGNDSRTGPTLKLPLQHGDVVVWGGTVRLAYHGVAPLKPGEHRLLGGRRLNLTFRRAA